MTSSLFLRALEHVHGHLGWLAIAALVHPAILLRASRRRAPARLAVVLAAGLVSVAFAMGMSLYPDYRIHVRPVLFREAPSVALAFERKEHLAVTVVAFALIGCVAHFAALRMRDQPGELEAARLAHVAFVLAAILAIVVGVLGVTVASVQTF